MNIVIYKSTVEFKNDNLVVLTENYVELRLFWKNVLMDLTNENGFFGFKVYDEEEYFMALRCHSFPLICHTNAKNPDNYVEFIINEKIVTEIPDTIGGTANAVQAFEKLLKKKNIIIKSNYRLDIMLCNKLNTLKLPDVKLVYKNKVEGNLTPNYIGFYIDCRFAETEEEAIEGAEKTAVKMNDSSSLLCALVDNRIVSIGGRYHFDDNFNSITLGHVHTLRAYRNRNLSTAVIYKLVKDSFSEGIKNVILFVHNPIAKHVYEKVGFKPVAVWQELKVKQ